MKMRYLFIFWLVLGSALPGIAQEGLKLTGKVRLLEPMVLKLTGVDGKEVFSATVENNQPFSLGPERIEPDVYILSFGETKQAIYLTNREVTIKGFYDSRNPGSSSLSFTGIDEFMELSKWVPTEPDPQKRAVKPEAKEQLEGNMYSALAYLADMTQYEANKMVLEWIPEKSRNTASAKWLAHRVDSLGKFAVGAQAYDFEFVDTEGKKVRLSDFRGRLVLVDFWASWCGPCRREMKSLLPIYEELKGEDLEFISVSLDNREADWRKMLEEEKLPWVMLWNQEGFTAGNEPNVIQRAYGFYSIPFIVLIDKDGKIIERGLRGEKVKEAILKARQGK